MSDIDARLRTQNKIVNVRLKWRFLNDNQVYRVKVIFYTFIYSFYMFGLDLLIFEVGKILQV